MEEESNQKLVKKKQNSSVALEKIKFQCDTGISPQEEEEEKKAITKTTPRSRSKRCFRRKSNGAGIIQVRPLMGRVQ